MKLFFEEKKSKPGFKKPKKNLLLSIKSTKKTATYSNDLTLNYRDLLLLKAERHVKKST